MALVAAAFLYTNQHPQLHWIMTAALPAFLIEAVFYLGAMFHETRVSFAIIGLPRAQAALLWVSALVPYLVFSLSAGTFDRRAFYLLAFLTAVLAFWYALLPRRIAYDVGFLVIAAAPLITRVFHRIYRAPDDHTRIDVLGHLMWIRLGVIALIVLREWDPGPFGLWPRAREWKIGVLWYVLVLAPICVLGVGVQDLRFSPLHDTWWHTAVIAIGVFFGILWVVALAEELFFRGVIERALLHAQPSPALAVLVSALLFGSAHLWFHRFPDWRTASVAALLGIACGIAYAQTRSVRASMVTHAFVVVTWRVFFR